MQFPLSASADAELNRCVSRCSFYRRPWNEIKVDCFTASSLSFSLVRGVHTRARRPGVSFFHTWAVVLPKFSD